MVERLPECLREGKNGGETREVDKGGPPSALDRLIPAATPRVRWHAWLREPWAEFAL